MSEILSPDVNPAYGDWKALPPSLWKEVASLNPRVLEIEPQGLKILDGIFHLPFLGETLRVDPKQRQMAWRESVRSPTFQEGLVALTFLGHYKPIGLSKRWISPAELPGGRSFFSECSHPLKMDWILDCWHQRHNEFLFIIERLRGFTIPSGDEAVEISCLPLIPIRYVFYRNDGSLPATATPLVNATLPLFLPPDVVWALFNLVDQKFSPGI